MVQVISDPYSGNVFGRIGKGLGQGLSEQLPKEIERGRLSKGLKTLSEKAKNEKLSPLDIFTEAAGIPGITPQHLYTMAPILNQQVQKQNFLSRGKGVPGQTPDQMTNQGNGQIAKGPSTLALPTAAEDSGFASPSQIADYKKGLMQEPDFPTINALAKEYLNEGITQDPNEANKLALQEIQTNRQAQQQKIEAFKNDFGGDKGRFALELQRGPLGGESFSAVAGEIQQALLDQGEYLMNKQGLTPEEASLQMSNIAKELGKTTNKTLDTGSFENMFKSRQAKITDLKSQKKDFEKYGFGEQFDDIAASALGITPLEAANVLSPLKNKEIENVIAGTKKVKQKSTENNIQPATLDKIIKSITPKDNLFAIEYLLRDKQLDIQQFKRRIQEMEDAKEIALTPQQKRQMQRSVSESFLGDLLFENL